MPDPIADLRSVLSDVADSVAVGPGAPRAISLERPPKADFGDFSTNAPMLLAGDLKTTPRDIADRMLQSLEEALGGDLDRAEIAGPGFINVFLSDAWYRRAAAESLSARREGGETAPSSEKASDGVLIEFVSANPTGPLTAAGGRHAAYGDSVARALEATGNAVLREYYVNDTGGQITRFGLSIAARMRGQAPPEDGYEGEYIQGIAEQLAGEGVDAEETDELETRGTELMRSSAEQTLSRFGVEFDTWFSERDLHADGGGVERTMEDLRQSGNVYESDGAIWLRTTDFGDDKDRVLVRSGGESTYYLADIAYHRDKLERGGGHLIDVLGADHHGYVIRLPAALEALGLDPGRLEVAIMQLVHIVEGGDRSQMSKRKGEFVSLDELVDDIGVDAARFFMLQRSHDTPIDLDLDLARQRSSENPVYYVQYAHARLVSILERAGDSAVRAALAADGTAVAPLNQSEKSLTLRLLEFPEVILETAERRAPHRLCAYATATAADFHAFYRDCKVVGAEGEGVEAERLRLAVLARLTIAATLDLLGIKAPEHM